MAKLLAEIPATLDKYVDSYVVYSGNAYLFGVCGDALDDLFHLPFDAEKVWFRLYDKPTKNSVAVTIRGRGDYGNIVRVDGVGFASDESLRSAIRILFMAFDCDVLHVEVVY